MAAEITAVSDAWTEIYELGGGNPVNIIIENIGGGGSGNDDIVDLRFRIRDDGVDLPHTMISDAVAAYAVGQLVFNGELSLTMPLATAQTTIIEARCLSGSGDSTRSRVRHFKHKESTGLTPMIGGIALDMDATVWQVARTVALADSLVVKTAAGFLKELWGKNESGAAVYVHVYDLAAVPADGNQTASLIFSPLEVAAGSEFVISTESGSIPFSNGLVVCTSSTQFNKTITVGSTTLLCSVLYK